MVQLLFTEMKINFWYQLDLEKGYSVHSLEATQISNKINLANIFALLLGLTKVLSSDLDLYKSGIQVI